MSATDKYEIPAAKAMLGAALIQYVVYGFFYVIEGAKLEEFEGKSSASGASSS